MDINIKQFEQLKDVDYILYILIKTIVEENEFANKTLINKKNLLKKLTDLNYIRIIDNKINPTNGALALMKVAKSDAYIILARFNEYKREYMNNKRLSKMTPSTKKFIIARLKDYSVDDISGVIKMKFDQWSNSNMQSYLRFETLLNATKFESYIQEYENSINNTTSKYEFE